MAATRRTSSSRVKTSRGKSSRDKVRAHRERLRKMGLRPVEIWVPDISSEEFAREAHRQSRLIARSAHAEEDQAFVDAVSEWDELPEWND